MFKDNTMILTNGVIVDSFVSKTFDDVPVEMILKSDEDGCIIRLPGQFFKAVNHYEIVNKQAGCDLFHTVSVLTELEVREEINKLDVQ